MSGKVCRWRVAWFLAVASMLLVASATAAVPDTLKQRVAACTRCHGTQGQGGDNGFDPRLAGKPELYLYHQLINFRDGLRNYPMMRHMVTGLSEDYLREMAKYFAAQSPAWQAPTPSPLPDTILGKGRELVDNGDRARRIPACKACHGTRLTGREPAIPGLIGLPSDYIRSQLGAWRNGSRHAAAPDCMAKVAERLSARDINLVAAWLASQPAPDDATPAPASSAPLPMTCGSMEQ